MRKTLCAALLALVGCDDHIFPVGESEGYTADWEGAERLFADHCETCHPSLSQPSIEDLEADIADGTGLWIVPGDPAASEFWLVLVDESSETASMPLGSPPLPREVVQPLFDWIEAGAALE